MKNFSAFIVALFLVNGAMAQWFPQNSGTTKNLKSVYFTDANTGYAVGDSGTILKTTNGGIDWICQTSGTMKWLMSVFFPVTDTGYVVGDSGTILKTTNGGIDWICQTSGTMSCLRSIFFPATGTGYAVGENGTILKTLNGGIDWTGQTSGTDAILSEVYFTDINKGYAASQGEGILNTTDGNTWIIQYGVGDGNTSVFFIDENTGYDVSIYASQGSYGSTVYKTTDSGMHWTGIFGYPDIFLASIFFTSENTGYTVGMDGTILRTINGGAEWIAQDVPTSHYLCSVYFADDTIGYIVGDHGCIFKTVNGGFPVGINDPKEIVNTLTIHPNPATGNITLATPAIGTLSIHNSSGHQLLQQEITEPSTTIEVCGLPSGVYFVRVTGERLVQVGKFIKQ